MNKMVLKRHEDKPWEWEDSICFLQHHGKAECDGVMELKDVNLKGDSQKVFSAEVSQVWIYVLEKTWVCNVCGCVFVE